MNKKDTAENANYSSEPRKVHEYFTKHTGTMLDCEHATGVRRENVCRYVAALEDGGRIMRIYKSEDRTTGRMAGYYTCNKNLWPNHHEQHKLF